MTTREILLDLCYKGSNQLKIFSHIFNLGVYKNHYLRVPNATVTIKKILSLH